MPFRLSFAAPRRRRRSPSFDGDFRLEDLFQQHIESEEEDVDDDDEMVDIEPLLYDEKKEAAWVAEKAEALKRAAEEKAREAEEKKRAAEEKAREAERRERSRKKHDAVIKSIRRYDPKAKCLVWTRFPFEDFSSFDLDEESAVPSMRHTNKTYQTECARYCSANILSVKVISSDVGFPIHVYGTVIARDSLDKKCVYIFQCHRRNSQLIMSEDESLILTGPARGLLLIDFIFLETDLKIKGERGQDKQLSKGLLQIDGRRLTWENIEAVTCASRLSTVEVKYAVVKDAVEATVEIQVPHGNFYGEITAHTTSVLHRIVLYDSKAVGAATSGGIQLWRRTIAVCLNEKLIFTIDTEASNDIQIIHFSPSLNGASQHVIYCGAIKLCLTVTWSVIDYV